jgi:hypothetical protein
MVMPGALHSPIWIASVPGSEDPEPGGKEMTGSDHGCGMMPKFSESVKIGKREERSLWKI